MKNILLILILLLFTSCNTSSHSKANYQIHISNSKGNSKKLNLNDTIQIKVSLNQKNIPVETIFWRNQPLKKTEKGFLIHNIKLGKQHLKIVVSNQKQTDTLESKITVYAEKAPEIWTYKIINTYPRQSDHYTQGLEFQNDTLYESIGLYGKSKLLKVDFKTGKIFQQTSLSPNYFGEGITFFNEDIYQLTWQEHKAFVYNSSTLKQIKTFSYPQQGWGICSDKQRLYMSDGSERIWYINPVDFSVEDSIQLCSNTSIFEKANELEWANEKIYANTYTKDGIMIINPKNGAIEGIIDMRGLKEHVTQIPSLDVLNGIAYNPVRKTFFVTGKNWDKLFEVQFLKK